MTASDYSALCKQSPDKAYKTLFDEYCNYVYAVVNSKLRSCASREDIEECVSDIFAEIYTKYDTEEEYEGDMRGYISVIANRRAINVYHLLTKQTLTVSIDDENTPEIADDRDIEQENEQAELSRVLLEKVISLGEPDSTIVVQKYFYNRTFAEISKLIEMNPASVRVRCRRAMARLKKLIDRKEFGF
ncbi:MAG: sigma-70 family RNA polymerase sigma factor [Ruminococcus sp.]|nr:sigma-70 family RNA polymerase sigma factor [Ruminococcus sp.]